jgi:antitoxin component of MazEF toxin-antitoxin module
MLPDTMTTVKFVGKVSTMGDKLIIVIPKDFHKQINPLKGQQVKVVVEEAIS